MSIETQKRAGAAAFGALVVVFGGVFSGPAGMLALLILWGAMWWMTAREF